MTKTGDFSQYLISQKIGYPVSNGFSANSWTTKVCLAKKKLELSVYADKGVVVSGIFLVCEVVKLRQKLKIVPFVKDGDQLTKKTCLLVLSGFLSEILAIKDDMISLLEKMSGIATLTRKYYRRIERSSVCQSCGSSLPRIPCE